MKPRVILREFEAALARAGLRSPLQPRSEATGRFLPSQLAHVYAEVAQRCGCSVRTIRRALAHCGYNRYRGANISRKP